MAGKIIADTIEASGSQISLNVGNVTVFTASSTGLATANITTANITTANITGNLLVGTTTAQTGAKLSVTGGIQGTITSGTAVATTSGTSFDFTSIPSWVKRITVSFNGISTSGSSQPTIRMGSGSIESTGYAGAVSSLNHTGSIISAVLSDGFQLIQNHGSSIVMGGSMVLTLVSGNIWVANAQLGRADGNLATCAGYKTFSGTIDRLRLTTVNGTDTFDAGSINILYEG